MYDPYNYVSFVELNKRKRGEYERDPSERIENRTQKPSVKKIYIKKNGDPSTVKPKLYIWRQWQSPTLSQLLELVAPYVGIEEALFLYEPNGRRITHEEEVRENGLYYVTGDETFYLPHEYDPPQSRRYYHGEDAPHRDSNTQPRRDSNTQPRLRDYDYDRDPRAPTHYERDGRYDRRSSYDRSESRYDRRDPYESRGNQYGANDRYNDDYSNEYTHERKARKKQTSAPAAPVRSRAQSLNRDRQRPRSIDDPAPGSLGYSDFDDEAAMARDRQALEKHKQKNQTTRRASAQIFNRKDQTHPDAYIIYVFLNGQGMECQFVSFQKKQLEKGMQFMLELVARRYNVNPARLCNMDGKKINEVSDLMSRGAYVLVPAGQSFRDTWYFLPDNAIDTSSDKQKVRERSAQRDRLIQRREKVESVKAKRTPAPRTKSQEYYRR